MSEFQYLYEGKGEDEVPNAFIMDVVHSEYRDGMVALTNVSVFSLVVLEACPVPYVIRGAWYSREWGRDTVTEFDVTSMSERGECIDMLKTHNDNFTFVFLDSSSCYHCVQILVRTVNIIEKRESEF